MSLFHRVGMVVGVAALGLLAVTASAADVDTSQQADGFSIQADELAAFSVNVSKAKAKVGSETTINVTVSAGDGFKCNDKYPHKIKDISGANVKAPSKVKGSASKRSISYSIPVTPTKAGSHTLSGQIRFSVCNENECKIKKVPLSATVTGT